MKIPEDKASTNCATAFFDKRASVYNCASSRFPWSLQRKRESKIVSGFIGDISGLSALDLGCGAGFYSRLLLSCGAKEVTAVDMSQAMIEHLNSERITGIVGNSETITLSKRFDLVVCAGMMEFTKDPERVFVNARKHVNKGQMVMLMPRAGCMGMLYRIYHKLHGLNIRLFDLGQVKVLAEKSGWKLVGSRKVFPFTLVLKFEAQ